MTPTKNNTMEGQQATEIADAPSRITFKLPALWEKNPTLYFVHIERIFRIKNITDDDLKFCLVAQILTEEQSSRIESFLMDPPETGRYEAMKEQIIKRYALNLHERAKILLNMPPLGDRKPSEYLRYMRQLRGSETNSNFLFHEIFLQNMPQAIRQAFSAHGALDDLDEVALKADEMFAEESSKPQDDPIFQIQSRRGHSRGRGQRGSFRGRFHGNQRYCYLHSKYGTNAHRCLSDDCHWEEDNRNQIHMVNESQPGNDERALV